MTPLTLGVLPPPLLEGNCLRPARLFDNLARDAGAFDKRGSQSRFAVLGQHEHMIERHAVAGFAGKRHDGDRIPSCDAILFAAGFDDCEQLKSFVFHPARAGEAPSMQRSLLACRYPGELPAKAQDLAASEPPNRFNGGLSGGDVSPDI